MQHPRPGWHLPLAMAMLLSAAAYIRLIGTGWDGGAGLHPDERHMVFVITDMLGRLAAADPLPGMFAGLFTPGSPLDPRAGGRSLVYGEFPVLVTAGLAWITERTDWTGPLLIGRSLSALIDASAVVAVMLTASVITKRAGLILLAGALYAAAPTALQLANFLTADAWLCGATAWAMLGLVALPGHARPALAAALAGVALGLAPSAKLPGLALFLPAAVALLLLARDDRRAGLRAALAMALMAALTFRLANPFTFSGWVALNPQVLSDLRALSGLSANPDFPPNWQWMAGYPLPALLRDLALFGTGPVIALGLLMAVFRRVRAEIALLWLILLPPLVYAVTSPAPALRYAAPALPAAAVLATLGLAMLPRRALPFAALLALWWGSGVVILHGTTHPRLIASHWLAQLPPGAVVAHETDWDEPLPVQPYFHPDWLPPHQLRHRNLDLTTPDDAAKAARLARIAAEADVIAISSERQRAVMPRLPERFPLTAAWYRALASGAFCYRPALHLDRGYPLPFLPFSDAWAQEPWRIYDHPVVTLYTRGDCAVSAGLETYLVQNLP